MAGKLKGTNWLLGSDLYSQVKSGTSIFFKPYMKSSRHTNLILAALCLKTNYCNYQVGVRNNWKVKVLCYFGDGQWAIRKLKHHAIFEKKCLPQAKVIAAKTMQDSIGEFLQSNHSEHFVINCNTGWRDAKHKLDPSFSYFYEKESICNLKKTKKMPVIRVTLVSMGHCVSVKEFLLEHSAYR